MGAHAGVTLSHTHGTTCAYKQRSGGVKLKLGWPTWKSYGLNKQAVVTLVIVSRHDAHSITFLLQIATLPRLCCSTTLSLLCVAALQCLACFCRAVPLAPPSLANSCWVCVGGHTAVTLCPHTGRVRGLTLCRGNMAIKPLCGLPWGLHWSCG